jgi:hypothetical protein
MDDASLVAALVARTVGSGDNVDLAQMLATSGELPAARLPVSHEAVTAVERRLGFALPSLLRRIYLEVANGGFGPGYGLVGLSGGHACSFGTLADAHERLAHDPRAASGLPPDRLVLWQFGSTSFACVDASSPNAEVVWLDLESGGGDVFRPSGRTLSACLSAWLAGKELYDELRRAFA